MYQSDFGIMKREHRSVVVQTIHLWRHKGTKKEALVRMDYNILPRKRTNHPLFTNVIVDITWPLEGEKLLPQLSLEFGRYTMPRPYQMNISLAENINSNFTGLGDLVIDPFRKRLAVAKAFIRLKMHFKFPEWDVSANNIKLSYLSLLRVNAELV